jgi:hypothetical protein
MLAEFIFLQHTYIRELPLLLVVCAEATKMARETLLLSAA